MVDETAYKFKLDEGIDAFYRVDYTRVQNAICTYLWEQEHFSKEKGFYFDWTNVTSTRNSANPAEQSHNVTFSIRWDGDDKDFPEDIKKFWAYNDDKHPGRCIDYFWFATEYCYCKGDECGADGSKMNWGGSYENRGFIFKVASYPISPSYWWTLMGNGDENVNLNL